MNAKEREYFEKDICRYYRSLAGSTKYKIQVIADLNCRSEELIMEILVRGGEISTKKQEHKKPYPKGLEEMVDKVDRKELSGSEAADRLGITYSLFQYYRGRILSERKEKSLIEEAAQNQNVAAGQ